MVLYVYFIMQHIVVACANAGCSISSDKTLLPLIAAGSVELIIEIIGVLRIYRKKDE